MNFKEMYQKMYLGSSAWLLGLFLLNTFLKQVSYSLAAIYLYIFPFQQIKSLPEDRADEGIKVFTMCCFEELHHYKQVANYIFTKLIFVLICINILLLIYGSIKIIRSKTAKQYCLSAVCIAVPTYFFIPIITRLIRLYF